MTGDWRYVITRRAAQDLERLDLRSRARILAALDRLVSRPGESDRRKLQGQEDEWRLRVGRLRYWPDSAARTYVVLRVLPRGANYRD